MHIKNINNSCCCACFQNERKGLFSSIKYLNAIIYWLHINLIIPRWANLFWRRQSCISIFKAKNLQSFLKSYKLGLCELISSHIFKKPISLLSMLCQVYSLAWRGILSAKQCAKNCVHFLCDFLCSAKRECIKSIVKSLKN